MVLIAFIALVVVGPERLPGLFRQIGKGLAQFKKIQDDVKDMVQLDQYIDLKDPEGDFIKPPPPRPTPHTSGVADEERRDPIAMREAREAEETAAEDGPIEPVDEIRPAALTPMPDPGDDAPLSAP
jgi:Sec-independent protein translocase protein TatA